MRTPSSRRGAQGDLRRPGAPCCRRGSRQADYGVEKPCLEHSLTDLLLDTRPLVMIPLAQLRRTATRLRASVWRPPRLVGGPYETIGETISALALRATAPKSSGEDVHEEQRDDDDRHHDGDNGNRRGGEDHSHSLSQSLRVKPKRRAELRAPSQAHQRCGETAYAVGANCRSDSSS